MHRKADRARRLEHRCALLLLLALVGCASDGATGGGTPVPPTVTSMSPASGASGVAVASPITATFSESMTAATLTTATFRLSGGVTGVVTFGGRTATFTPSPSLSPNTTYTATVGVGARDATGVAMAADHTWSFSTVNAPAASGALDASFNTNGKVFTGFGTNEEQANAVALQSDGRIVVAGATSAGAAFDFAVARYNTDGTPDLTFDSDGKVATFIVGANSVDIASAMVIQPDGRIVVAGRADNTLALVRYNIDGSLDGTFGVNGKVTTTVLGGLTAAAVALQADGKIVTAGAASVSGGTFFAVARHNTNGGLDSTFGTAGVVTTPNIGGGCCGSYGAATAVTIQPNGRIVAAGASGTTLAIVRYLTNGSLDSTFDADGMAVTSVAFTSTNATSVLVQPNGRIVAGGNVGGEFALFRYNADGSLETIFERLVGPSDVLTAAMLQATGKIVAVGFTRQALNVNKDFVVVRYNADGARDTSFGTGGRAAAAIGGGFFDGGHALAIQADGRIVVAGSARIGTNDDIVVMRFLP